MLWQGHGACKVQLHTVLTIPVAGSQAAASIWSGYAARREARVIDGALNRFRSLELRVRRSGAWD